MDTERASDHKDEPRFPIAGIGASAGGVQALQKFFDALPPKVGAALVVVIHLDPEHESDLKAILAACTKMPVHQVQEPMTLEPDHVYVIPPNRRLFVTDHEISVAEFSEPRGHRAPIDLFFRSLAEHGDGYAIILTGAGSDGALGVKAVKERGGIILVQDPNEAEYPSMPRSAIASGHADFVLPIHELVRQFVALVLGREHSRVRDLDANEQALQRILGHLRARAGHDFSKYKRPTITRRIARRMQVTGLDDVEEYVNFLRDHVEEVQALFNELLISVTSFFRDPQCFEALAKLVVPHFFEEHDGARPIRVWIPGCATGEEAYSIAILLQEEAARHHVRPEIQLFATDMDGAALATAREGRYPVSIAADVSEDRLQRFFTKEGDHYHIKRDVREMILFAEHSLLKDPPFSHVSLISCRNVLIYLGREVQDQVLSTFNYALIPTGYLFLGSSETAETPAASFKVVNREACIYQSLGRSNAKAPPLGRGPANIRLLDLPPLPAMRPLSSSEAFAQHHRALELGAPPSLLVDQSHKILHLSETAGRYIVLPAGQPSIDAADIVRPELRLDLRTALQRAFQQGETSLSTPVAVQFNGMPRYVSLHVRPMRHEEAMPVALVLFLEGGEAGEAGASKPSGADGKDEQIKKLTDELFAVQANLRSSREAYATVTENLRAANEELQSINEEYRSTAEELESSKEELQSMNEELQTTNNELKNKLQAVSNAHSDLQNFMTATDVGTLFLDHDLHIRRFTPRVTELFNIKPGDEGRPITDFTHRLAYEGLIDDIRSVMLNLAPIEREVRSENRWLLMRLRPYRSLDDKIEGAIASFIDVTERRLAAVKLQESEMRLQLAREAAELGTIDYTTGQQEPWCDARALSWWGLKPDAKPTLEGLLAAIHSDDRAGVQAALDAALAAGSGRCDAEFRVWIAGEHAERWIRAKGVTTPSGDGSTSLLGRRRLVMNLQDITERRVLEEQQRLMTNELARLTDALARSREMLSLIHSIGTSNLKRCGAPPHAIGAFQGCLRAVAAVHEELVGADWRAVNLTSFARGLLGRSLGENAKRVRVDGPPVQMPAANAAELGLLLYELASDALAVGALRDGSGSVSLTWRLNTQNGSHLNMIWEERGERKAKPAQRTGLNSILLENALANIRVTEDSKPSGVVYSIEIPPAQEEAAATSVGTASQAH